MKIKKSNIRFNTPEKGVLLAQLHLQDISSVFSDSTWNMFFQFLRIFIIKILIFHSWYFWLSRYFIVKFNESVTKKNQIDIFKGT